MQVPQIFIGTEDSVHHECAEVAKKLAHGGSVQEVFGVMVDIISILPKLPICTFGSTTRKTIGAKKKAIRLHEMTSLVGDLFFEIRDLEKYRQMKQAIFPHISKYPWGILTMIDDLDTWWLINKTQVSHSNALLFTQGLRRFWAGYMELGLVFGAWGRLPFNRSENPTLIKLLNHYCGMRWQDLEDQEMTIGWPQTINNYLDKLEGELLKLV